MVNNQIQGKGSKVKGERAGSWKGDQRKVKSEKEK